jgi:hypothetical protein
MGEVISNTIDTSAENVGKTPDQLVQEAHDAAAAESVAAERPEWLPEKFKSPEDMAQAYAALESKMGSGEKPAEPVPEVPTAETVRDSGLDLNSLESEYRESGELSAESYEAAAKAGYSKEVVDKYIEGQQAVVEQQVNDIVSTVGGREGYEDLIGWAADNLSEGEIDAFNRTVESNDVDSIKLAVNGLQARRNSNAPADPVRQIEGGQAPMADKFDSWAQVKDAMSDPRYSTDPAYNNAVVQKLGRSQL